MGVTISNSTFYKNPCFKCEHGQETPKVCRSDCEKWKQFELDKQKIYKERHQRVIVRDTINRMYQSQFHSGNQRKKAKSKNGDY